MTKMDGDIRAELVCNNLSRHGFTRSNRIEEKYLLLGQHISSHSHGSDREDGWSIAVFQRRYQEEEQKVT